MAAAAEDDANGLEAVHALKIERLTTAERVADGLRTLIVHGNLRPGSVLREPALVEALDVSRNTLREAFRLLSHERLVVHHMHRGVEVRRLTREDVHDIYRTREALEVVAIESSAGLPVDRFAPLRDAVERAVASAKVRDWQLVGTCDILFHQRLVAMIGSPRVDAFFESVCAELRLAFAMTSDEGALHAPYVARNEEMLCMLEEGRQADCIGEMRRYLARAEEDVYSLLPD